MNLLRKALLLVLAVFISPAGAHGEFPTKPIRIISPYPPGGAADALARQLATPLAQRLGQPVIVENRPGASGTLGAAACCNAAPDGYTLCMLFSDVLAVTPYTFKRVPYDPVADFAPVIAVAELEGLLVARANFPASTLTDLAAYAKARPGTLNWSSFGVGSSSHLLLEKLNRALGLDILHVPYQGGGPALNALLGQEVQLSFVAVAQAVQHIQAGRLKPLAALGTSRLTTLPAVPTIHEQGVDFTSTVWLGLFAPAGTPPAVVGAVARASAEALADPAFVQQTLAPAGYRPLGGSPQALAERVARDQAAWGGIARSLNLALE